MSQDVLMTMTNDIISIDLKLRDRKPAGEPRHLRRLLVPGSTYELKTRRQFLRIPRL